MSSLICARCASTSIVADCSCATAAWVCPAMRPPLKTLYDALTPTDHWFFAPKPAPLRSKPEPDLQVVAWAIAASRCACVAFAGIRGVQSEAGPVVSGAGPASPSNCDFNVLV